MHKIPSPPQAFFDESGVNADDRVWDYGHACYALALSRGVPADMVLVPRKLTSDMADAYMRLFTGTERFSAERMWDGLLAAAPAAAGAQGEEPQWVASLRAEVFNSAMKDVFSLSRDEVAHLLGGLLSCAPPATAAPQPAAADGGVRERDDG